MDHVVIGWFPSLLYANLYAIIVLAALLSDEIIPRLMGGKGVLIKQTSDRGSFFLIYISAIVGVGLYFRYHNIGVALFWAQALALGLIIVGAGIREWAIVLLGRFFSRTLKVEAGQRLITGGPYNWIRHPAYTGMILIDTGIILGLGTWLGALIMFIVMLFPTLYRIGVEEKVLVETFGDEYRAFTKRTWRLFPGW